MKTRCQCVGPEDADRNAQWRPLDPNPRCELHGHPSARSLSSASFTDPVSLTAELLAEHGGTLPDGSYVTERSDGVAYPVRSGRAMDPLGSRLLAESLGWIRFVVYMGGAS